MVYGLHILEMISALRMVFYCSGVFNMSPVSIRASHQMALFSGRQLFASHQWLIVYQNLIGLEFRWV